jgi:ribosome-associated protein
MRSGAAHEQTRILVQAAAEACESKKGQDTRILELDEADSGLADFFLVTSASNDRQAIAIADEIEYRLKHDLGVMVHSVEGRRVGEWILLDYVDFVVHVFLAEKRAFYDIERLRKSARPMTPAEFDAELRRDLAKKTEAVRKRAGAKKSVAAKKVAVKRAAGKKAPETKSKPTVRRIVKKVAKKIVKTSAKKAAPKAVPAKKSAVKKKSAFAPKAPAKKGIAKGAAAKAVPAKKAAKKVVAKAASKPVKKAAKKAAKKSKK